MFVLRQSWEDEWSRSWSRGRAVTWTSTRLTCVAHGVRSRSSCWVTRPVQTTRWQSSLSCSGCPCLCWRVTTSTSSCWRSGCSVACCTGTVCIVVPRLKRDRLTGPGIDWGRQRNWILDFRLPLILSHSTGWFYNGFILCNLVDWQKIIRFSEDLKDEIYGLSNGVTVIHSQKICQRKYDAQEAWGIKSNFCAPRILHSEGIGVLSKMSMDVEFLCRTLNKILNNFTIFFPGYKLLLWYNQLCHKRSF